MRTRLYDSYSQTNLHYQQSIASTVTQILPHPPLHRLNRTISPLPKVEEPKSIRLYSSSEIVFWIVIFGLSASGAGKNCQGTRCVPGYALVVLGLCVE